MVIKEPLDKERLEQAKNKEFLNHFVEILSDKKILIVDDNQVNLTIASKMLEKVGVLITTATNGVESLERLKEDIFDAVLMDLQMPVMDGFQATKIIREDPKLKDLPVIAFSANVMKKDIDSALAAGMNAHLAKPLKLQTLLELIVEQLSSTTPNRLVNNKKTNNSSSNSEVING